MGSSPLLVNIIQLTVLIVGLLAAFKLVMSNNKMTSQIANGVQGLARRFGADKGLDKVRGKMGENAKKRAAYTGANLSQKLQDPNRFGGRPSRAIGGVANWRRNRAANAKVRELSLEARKGNREENIVSRTAEMISGGNTGLARSAVQVGGERVTAYAAAKTREQFNETMKREEATMTSLSSKELARALRDAIMDGNSERAHAASGLLVAKGAPGQTVAGDVLRDVAGADAVGTPRAEMAASIIRSSGSEFNAVSPDLTRWADQEMIPGASPTLNAVGASAAPYENASAEKIAGWSTQAILRGYQTAQAAGPAAVTEFEAQVTQVFNTPQLAGKLSRENRELLGHVQAGNVGAIPAPTPPNPATLYN